MLSAILPIMQNSTDKAYTYGYNDLPDGRIAFSCSIDHALWPWLALSPSDPIFVQTVNFWAAVETGVYAGRFDPTKWSALTQTDWECGDPEATLPIRGVAHHSEETPAPYHIEFYDAQDRLVYRMTGIGVVFQNRDFSAWRDKAKQEIAAAPTDYDFDYVPAHIAGIAHQDYCYLSQLKHDEDANASGMHAAALITKENGFPPIHPYHSGSGDHVNATHLADAARQYLHMAMGNREQKITGGEMTFKRYVELGSPFDISSENPDLVSGPDVDHGKLVMQISQAGNLCAILTLYYR